MTPFAKRGGRVKEEERGQLGLGDPRPGPGCPRCGVWGLGALARFPSWWLRRLPS